MTVKRYDLIYNQYFNGGGIGERPDGTYVKFSDYDAVVKERDNFKAAKSSVWKKMKSYYRRAEAARSFSSVR